MRDHHVYADIEGSRLGVFTLVLGSEAPEIVYARRYIKLDLIGEGMDAQIEYAQQSLDSIVEFLLSDRTPAERKSRIFKRPYLSIPMAAADEWKMKKFH
ncbi:hypothetical protein [Zafaria cholistanensis]|nr:hypothetical protein [Zafaria cholistanensis]